LVINERMYVWFVCIIPKILFQSKMSMPSSYNNPGKYIEECLMFFKEYHYIFCYPNTDILVKKVLSNIQAGNLSGSKIFLKSFCLSEFTAKDKYLKKFYDKIKKLSVDIPKSEPRPVEELFDAPLSPKKRYEIVNMVKEIGTLCIGSRCELLVDFGCGLVSFVPDNNDITHLAQY
jgi:hypothetical protein